MLPCKKKSLVFLVYSFASCITLSIIQCSCNVWFVDHTSSESLPPPSVLAVLEYSMFRVELQVNLVLTFRVQNISRARCSSEMGISVKGVSASKFTPQGTSFNFLLHLHMGGLMKGCKRGTKSPPPAPP